MRIEADYVRRFFRERPENGVIISKEESMKISPLYTRGGVRIFKRSKIFCSEENRWADLEPGDGFFIWVMFGDAPGGFEVLGYLQDEAGIM